MTEAEWLECDTPAEMVLGLPGKVSDRKLRIFACACCRQLTDCADDPWLPAVEAAERHAEQQAPYEELEQAWETLAKFSYGDAKGTGSRRQRLLLMAYRATAPIVLRSGTWTSVAREVAWEVSKCIGHVEQDDVLPSQLADAVRLLRCVFGNPFRPVSIDPAWLTPAVVSLATAAYERRHLPSGHLDNDRLVILADALEEAGCDNAEFLTHLRSPGPHVRGCWALDLILGKQ